MCIMKMAKYISHPITSRLLIARRRVKYKWKPWGSFQLPGLILGNDVSLGVNSKVAGTLTFRRPRNWNGSTMKVLKLPLWK